MGVPTGREGSGKVISIPVADADDGKHLMSIFSCARPCAKASGTLVHLTLVTSIAEMETEDCKVK